MSSQSIDWSVAGIQRGRFEWILTTLYYKTANIFFKYILMNIFILMKKNLCFSSLFLNIIIIIVFYITLFKVWGPPREQKEHKSPLKSKLKCPSMYGKLVTSDSIQLPISCYACNILKYAFFQLCFNYISRSLTFQKPSLRLSFYRCLIV